MKMKGPEPSDTDVQNTPFSHFFSPKQNQLNYYSLKSQQKL